VRGTFLLTLLVSASIFPLLILRSTSVEADEIITRVPSDFSTIQEAINASPPNRMILVSGGTYHEHLIINKAVRLVGVDKTSSIIDGGNNGTAVAVTANDVQIDGFTIQNGSEWGILLDGCSNCTVRDNLIVQDAFDGILLNYSHSNTVIDNVVQTIGGSADNELRWGFGVELEYSHNNTITRNMITECLLAGIALSNSDNNSLCRNVMENNEYGIALGSSNNNVIHHNVFIGNTARHVSGPYYSDNNTWDDGTEGNYWDDYLGLDDGSNGQIAGDGVGDTDLPHLYVDSRPLVHPPEPIPIVWDNTAYLLTLLSNSTVSTIRFAQTDKKIVFNVKGPSNTTGYFNASIPKALLSGSPWKIILNGTDVTSQAIVGTNQTHASIYLGYAHSSHDVQLIGTSVVPEYPTPGILVLMMLLTLLSTINCRTKKRCNCP
jgi:parallel beta-helix repeat protein